MSINQQSAAAAVKAIVDSMCPLGRAALYPDTHVALSSSPLYAVLFEAVGPDVCLAFASHSIEKLANTAAVAPNRERGTLFTSDDDPLVAGYSSFARACEMLLRQKRQEHNRALTDKEVTQLLSAEVVLQKYKVCYAGFTDSVMRVSNWISVSSRDATVAQYICRTWL